MLFSFAIPVDGMPLAPDHIADAPYGCKDIQHRGQRPKGQYPVVDEHTGTSCFPALCNRFLIGSRRSTSTLW